MSEFSIDPHSNCVVTWLLERPLHFMQCVHQSRARVLQRVLPSLFFLRRFVPRTCSLTPVWRLTSCLVLLQLCSILLLPLLPSDGFLILHLCTLLSVFQACRKRVGHSLSAESWTCLIETHPHVRCVHFVVYVQLDHCSISCISNVRILFSQHHSAGTCHTSSCTAPLWSSFLWVRSFLWAARQGVP